MKNILFILFAVLPIFSLYAQNALGEDKLSFVAHRGASYLAPENTMASIRLAWKLGADAAKCDIMLTRDKQVILCQDKNTKNRTRNPSLPSRNHKCPPEDGQNQFYCL